jgi:hypothetical protein
MLNVIVNNFKVFFTGFLHLPLNTNLNSYSNRYYSDNLGTKSAPNLFKNVFTYTYTSVIGLLSLQKVQYIGLHVASVGR